MSRLRRRTSPAGGAVLPFPIERPRTALRMRWEAERAALAANPRLEGGGAEAIQITWRNGNPEAVVEITRRYDQGLFGHAFAHRAHGRAYAIIVSTTWDIVDVEQLVEDYREVVFERLDYSPIRTHERGEAFASAMDLEGAFLELASMVSRIDPVVAMPSPMARSVAPLDLNPMRIYWPEDPELCTPRR